jgi:GR25 family glycosyltransferase involved in LPS biosynthesis
MESFNWKQYLANYPDLQEFGIHTQLKAWKHYNRFGIHENRTDLKFIHGINNVDIFYFINLDHRTDRLEHIIEQFEKWGLDPKKINRIPAILNKERGIAGCTLSHIKVLEIFIESGLDNCVIFEDDFTFTQDLDIVNSKFNDFFNSSYFDNFDVVMLAGSTMTEFSITDYLTRVHHSQTTSGYIVSKSFAPKLLENFRETDILDSNWLKLQPISNWYSFSPRLGLQMESYSDITHKLENYRL